MKTLVLLLLCSSVFAQTYDYDSPLSSGIITAEVTVTNGTVSAYSAQYAANGLTLSLDTTDPSGITFTPAGPVFAFDQFLFHYGNLTLDFGGGTDSVIFTNSGWNPVCGGEFGSATPCLIQDSGKSGTWTQARSIQAPEINPGAGITAFLILGFGLQVIRSRT